MKKIRTIVASIVISLLLGCNNPAATTPVNDFSEEILTKSIITDLIDDSSKNSPRVIFLDLDDAISPLAIPLTDHISVTAGDTIELITSYPQELTWESDNHNLQITDNTIRIGTVQQGPDARAILSAINNDGDTLIRREITIVNWETNKSQLILAEVLPNYVLLAKEASTIYFSSDKDLFKTNDSFITIEFITELPAIPSNTSMLITPFGYFLRCGTSIFTSKDLINWTEEFKTLHDGLYHMFDYYYDYNNATGFVYVGEYSPGSFGDIHKLYRGKYSGEDFKDNYWETILSFNYSDLYNRDDTKLYARHIHAVMVDPYSGHVWVGTGDLNEDSMILYSQDHGDHFNMIGIGYQNWRTLSFWFSEDYVYWNMDTAVPTQSIWKINREVYNSHNEWPTIVKQIPGGYYSTYDYRVRAVLIDNGTHWYTTKANDSNGNSLVIMGAAPEGVDFETRKYPGTFRDLKGRIFAFKEQANGDLVTQELLSISTGNNEEFDSRYTQLEPKLQDNQGYIYFKSRNLLDEGIYKMKLIWND